MMFFSVSDANEVLNSKPDIPTKSLTIHKSAPTPRRPWDSSFVADVKSFKIIKWETREGSTTWSYVAEKKCNKSTGMTTPLQQSLWDCSLYLSFLLVIGLCIKIHLGRYYVNWCCGNHRQVWWLCRLKSTVKQHCCDPKLGQLRHDLLLNIANTYGQQWQDCQKNYWDWNELVKFPLRDKLGHYESIWKIIAFYMLTQLSVK